MIHRREISVSKLLSLQWEYTYICCKTQSTLLNIDCVLQELWLLQKNSTAGIELQVWSHVIALSKMLHATFNKKYFVLRHSQVFNLIEIYCVIFYVGCIALHNIPKIIYICTDQHNCYQYRQRIIFSLG